MRLIVASIAILVLGVLTVAVPCSAHQFRPAVLALKEVAPGRFAVNWAPPMDGAHSAGKVRPRFPEHCEPQGETIVDCGARGLVGEIRFDALASFSQVNVDIEWFGGPRVLRVAAGEPPTVQVNGVPSEVGLRQRAELAQSYLVLGVEHILFGVDHLLFVVGLLLFVRSGRRLLLTITAFTLAHSVTLALSVLEFVNLPSTSVELCIALSILLLAIEATLARETWTRRAPWLVAFVCGLLHGFGFASALSDVGLPPNHVPLALLTFNLGVEAGQLLAIGVITALWRTLVRTPSTAARVQAFVIVGLGSAAVYFCLDRVLPLLRDYWAA